MLKWKLPDLWNLITTNVDCKVVIVYHVAKLRNRRITGTCLCVSYHIGHTIIDEIESVVLYGSDITAG